MLIPNIGFTHSGTFHADDVFATALLKIINPNIKINRISDISEIKEKEEYIVYDIGLGEFDHHQINKRIRKNGIPYAAFGLLWDKFGRLVIQSEKDRTEFDRQFIQTLDQADNYGDYNSLCDAIRSFNPNMKKENDIEFEKAVIFARNILENKLNKIKWEKSMKATVDKILKNSDKVAVLESYIPPKLFIGTKIKIMIYPSGRNCYNVQIIPKSNIQFSTKWTEKKSYMMSKYTSFIFCNEKRYLLACSDLKEAIKIAESTIKQKRI